MAEQITLGDAVQTPARQHAVERRWQAEPDGSCERCDRGVEPDVARVVGNENGTVPVCRHCCKATNGRSYGTTVAAVHSFRTSGRSVRLLELGK